MKPSTERKPIRGSSSAMVAGPSKHVLEIGTVEIDEHCTGSRWVATDMDLLARIIAIVAMGQAQHAARIISALSPAAPALDEKVLRSDAKNRLSVRGATESERDASRWQRDGLLFEVISWVAAHQVAGDKALVSDPHLSSTTPGIDGLMIELDDSGARIVRATIFEDKCSEKPRDMFRDRIMPTFMERHADQRCAELVAAAATLIAKSDLDGTESTRAVALILDKRFRVYRASLAVTTSYDSVAKRKHLFKGYETLEGIAPDQRVGATFITSTALRAWFDDLSVKAVKYIDKPDTGGT